MQPLKRNFVKTISLVIPLATENMVSLLSPTLGQCGIVVSDFVAQLNFRTQLLCRELTVRVSIQLYSNTTYTFSFDLLNYSYLNFCLKNHGYSIHTFYSLIYLYSLVNTYQNSGCLKRNYLNFKGYLHSFN